MFTISILNLKDLKFGRDYCARVLDEFEPVNRTENTRSVNIQYTELLLFKKYRNLCKCSRMHKNEKFKLLLVR